MRGGHTHIQCRAMGCTGWGAHPHDVGFAHMAGICGQLQHHACRMPQVCCGLKPSMDEDERLAKKPDLGSSVDKKWESTLPGELKEPWQDYAYLVYDMNELYSPTGSLVATLQSVIGGYTDWELVKGILDASDGTAAPFVLRTRAFSYGISELTQWCEGKPFFQASPLRFPTTADVAKFLQELEQYKAFRV